MEKNAKIYVAGHLGMVGSAIMRQLESRGYTNIVTRTFEELDLRRQEARHENSPRQRHPSYRPAPHCICSLAYNQPFWFVDWRTVMTNDCDSPFEAVITAFVEPTLRPWK